MYYYAYSTEPGFGTVRSVHNSEFDLGTDCSGNILGLALGIAYYSVRNLDPAPDSVTASPSAVSHTPAFHW